MKYDLVIRNGLVVNSTGSEYVDIGISDEKIVQLGGHMDATNTVDASGKFVLPGGIDIHVHLSSPRDPSLMSENWVDDFYTGSQAALAGGITTIGNMTFQWAGQSLQQSLDRDLSAAKNLAAVDFILHPILTAPTPESIAEIRTLAANGYHSLKIFMVADNFDDNEANFLEAIKVAGESNLMIMMHCEDRKTIRTSVSELESQGMLHISNWAESRPKNAEEIAVARAVHICRETGAPIYVVHLSSEGALKIAREAKRQGLPFYVEVRPMYLHLTKELLKQDDGAKYIGAPPLRDMSDIESLWSGIKDGSIDAVASDHAPFSLAAKLDTRLDVTTARQGVADLETSLPLLFAKGISEHDLSLSRFVQLTSTRPAQLFGLWPKKGQIAIGADADIVLWDPKARQIVRGEFTYSRAKYSVYEGMTIVGIPVMTISRGEILMNDGVVSAMPGRGRWQH
jgi:dihydropyrimidinase